MEDMHLILRWHGEKDPISLRQYAQIPNLYGIVTSLYHLPLGQVWDRAEVLRLKEQIEAHGLKFELVDSFRIHEDIKRGYASRDALIENYRKNIRMLAECGIRIICYNFMPVFDWTRTDLAHVLPDGSDCLSFEEEKVRAVDPERGIELPGWGTNHTPAELQALLHSYRGIGEEELWDNCRYFLRAVLPVAEECGVKLALHPSNTIAFCCGSLGSAADNDLPAMIREFGPRGKLPFVHFRNVQREPGGDFYESGHQTGCGSNDMGEIMRALCDMGRPFCLRPDHGRRIWDEAWSVREVTGSDGVRRREHRPDGWDGVRPAAGYGLFDRALGAAYAQGLYEGIRRERAAQLTKE